jgi:hypothetical protein
MGQKMHLKMVLDKKELKKKRQMTCTFSDFKMLPDDTKLPLLAMMN